MTDDETITMPGRVMLPGGDERDCMVQCGPDVGIELVFPVAVETGAHLVCHVTGLGVVEGTAGDATGSGCMLAVRATPSHHARLAARIAWHRRRAAGQADQRESDRVQPTSTVVRLGWPDGRTANGTLIDLSATGAALRSEDRPEPGAQVVIGRRRAVVVRLLEEGFAVRFALPLRPQDVTPQFVL